VAQPRKSEFVRDAYVLPEPKTEFTDKEMAHIRQLVAARVRLNLQENGAGPDMAKKPKTNGFKQLEGAGSKGRLMYETVLKAFRQKLKLTVKEIDDDQAKALCRKLDPENTGWVETEALLKLANEKPPPEPSRKSISPTRHREAKQQHELPEKAAKHSSNLANHAKEPLSPRKVSKDPPSPRKEPKDKDQKEPASPRKEKESPKKQIKEDKLHKLEAIRKAKSANAEQHVESQEKHIENMEKHVGADTLTLSTTPPGSLLNGLGLLSRDSSASSSKENPVEEAAAASLQAPAHVAKPAAAPIATSMIHSEDEETNDESNEKTDEVKSEVVESPARRGSRGSRGSKGSRDSGKPGQDPQALFPIGSECQVFGLQQSPELNGQTATVIEFRSSKNRFRVKFRDGEVKLLKSSNMSLVSSDDDEAD
jgi:hypothetical protein